MLDAFEIVMMRKHLLGIKRRAERSGGETRQHDNDKPINTALHPSVAAMLAGDRG